MLPSAAAGIVEGVGEKVASEFLEADAPNGSCCWAWLEPMKEGLPFVLVAVSCFVCRMVFYSIYLLFICE